MRLPWVSRARHEAMRVGFATALGDAYAQHSATKADLAIAEDALEAERQWRLKSLPALLAAEEWAVRAEARIAQLERFESPHNPRQFPELRTNRALAAAYRAGVVVACTECGGRLDGSDDVHRGGTVGPDGHVPWAVHDRCYDTFLTQLDALAGDPS